MARPVNDPEQSLERAQRFYGALIANAQAIGSRFGLVALIAALCLNGAGLFIAPFMFSAFESGLELYEITPLLALFASGVAFAAVSAYMSYLAVMNAGASYMSRLAIQEDRASEFARAKPLQPTKASQQNLQLHAQQTERRVGLYSKLSSFAGACAYLLFFAGVIVSGLNVASTAPAPAPVADAPPAAPRNERVLTSRAQVAERIPGPNNERYAYVWDSAYDATLFLFNPSRVNGRGPHPRDQIYVVTHGSGNLVLEGEVIAFREGDVLFVPANSDHSFTDIEPDTSMWTISVGRSRPAEEE